MIFEKWLMPDRMFGHYYEITPDLVRSTGRSVLLCDIDNTLATYDDSRPPEAVKDWIEEMHREGISVAFVSNNTKERVELFNESLGCVAFAKAGKPKTKYLQAACAQLGVGREQAILLGDQLLTDCAAGKLFGIPAWIVPPIRDKKSLFFRFKRLLEKPYVRKYWKMQKMTEMENI
ncbi:MAG: YqeG family HAD IIIA-type phosphatase [Clostridiales bacterium]|nr:YqeG family HAD IIIA-type phosphatase [Clostridiales bacterium]